MNPVCQVFDLVVGNSEEVIFKDIIAEEMVRRNRNAMRKQGYADVSSFFSVVPKTESEKPAKSKELKQIETSDITEKKETKGKKVAPVQKNTLMSMFGPKK
jgi:hypothetical protein